MTQQNLVKKPIWTAWFPYPRAWLRTFVLALLMSAVIASLRLFGSLGVTMTLITSNLGPAILFGVVGLSVPFLLLSYVHHFLWGNQPANWPRKLPGPRSIWEGFYALVVMVLSFLVCTVLLSFHGFSRDYHPTDIEVKWLTAIWFVTAAYLYQVEYIIRRSLDPKLNIAAIPSTNKPLKPQLFHPQTNTSIQLPPTLSVVNIGKPNDSIPPDIDVSDLPNSETVSRIHAKIWVQGDIYFIEDVVSANGTFLNGTKLKPKNRYQLNLGDRINLGKGDLVTFILQAKKDNTRSNLSGAVSSKKPSHS